jgi:hypothetical protein
VERGPPELVGYAFLLAPPIVAGRRQSTVDRIPTSRPLNEQTMLTARKSSEISPRRITLMLTGVLGTGRNRHAKKRLHEVARELLVTAVR